MKKFKENDNVVFSKRLLYNDLIDVWKVRFEDNKWLAKIIKYGPFISKFKFKTGETFNLYNSDNITLGAINVKF